MADLSLFFSSGSAQLPVYESYINENGVASYTVPQDRVIILYGTDNRALVNGTEELYLSYLSFYDRYPTECPVVLVSGDTLTPVHSDQTLRVHGFVCVLEDLNNY